MYSRSVATSGGVDFARQLAERNSSNQATKKFRSTAAPKGAKLPNGYVDRTKERLSEDEDDKAARVKALEEMMKLQQIDQTTFEKLRDEIVGGDVSSVHLVKGLDYKLLERVRRGEDVLNVTSKGSEDETEEADVEEELEMLEDCEIAPVEKEKAVKKGEMAPPSLIPGKKRNRDQILAELKAARIAAKEKAGPSLGAKFKKVGAPRIESRIERDSKGREVLITVDEDGNEKRKVRRVQPDTPVEKGHGLLKPDKDIAPLGMEVPEIPKVVEDSDEDIDIFEDAGDDYHPLAGLDDEDDSDVEEDSATKATETDPGPKPKIATSDKPPSDSTLMPPPPRPRNYFGDASSTPPDSESTTSKALSDPTILAALKKASTLHSTEKAAESEVDAIREAKLKKMLQSQDRDAQDLDMGFGSSRFEDEEDFEEKRVKLSEWGGRGGGDEDEDGDGGKGEGKGKRKRGPKKRKGDGNNAADVLKVLERRKAAKS
jgi:uridine nucleosidase